jgi:hypothetical protein
MLRFEDCTPGTEVECIRSGPGCPLVEGKLYRIEVAFIAGFSMAFEDGAMKHEPMFAVTLQGDAFVDDRLGGRIGYEVSAFRLPPPERLDGLRALLRPDALAAFHEAEDAGEPRPREPGKALPRAVVDAPPGDASRFARGFFRRLFSAGRGGAKA